MKKLMLWTIAALAATGGALFAQNITGTWQGTLQPPGGRPPLRIVIKMSREADESLKAAFYSIDQNGRALNASAVTLQGSTLKLVMTAIGGNYEGKLSADGDSITGTWTQGDTPAPLNLVRATPTTTWVIPDPPPPPKLMAADATPVFEVATIKPSRPDAQGRSLNVGRGGGNVFTTSNLPAADLITFAYAVHAKQVTGGPAWLENERYDITAKPDLAGMPNAKQLRAMVQKLLAERFELVFHREKKELSAYTITVAKTGSKLTQSQSTIDLPGYGMRGPGRIGVQNSSMVDFADFMQSRILEKPVVDQTGLTGRYDFMLQWTPDASQAAAAGGGAPPPPVAADAPPDLFAAIQQQLGLKLESTKTLVEVLVIDKIQKPSDN